MRYLTPAECRALGLEPYAVYGGMVSSYRKIIDGDNWIFAHGSAHYAERVAAADEMAELRGPYTA